MSVELAVAAALAAGYTDSRLRFSKDLHTVFSVTGANIYCRLMERMGRINFFNAFEKIVEKNPNNIALVYPRQVDDIKDLAPGSSLDTLFQVDRYTYRQMYEMILKYARVLYFELGVKRNDTVALDALNSDEFVFVWFALWSLGATPALINYNLSGKALLHCISAATTNLVIVDPEADGFDEATTAELASKGTKTVFMDAEFHTKVQNAQPYCSPLSDRNPDHHFWDPALLIYTSGTTGLPKAAVMSWQKAFLGGASFGLANKLRKRDIFYSAMPLYHSTATVLGVMPILWQGGAFAVGRKFSTRTFWTQCKLCDATVIQYVGETCRYLVNAPPGPDDRNHKVRKALGNGMRPDVWAKFKDRFGIETVGEVYAATEFPSALHNHQEGDFGVGAVSSYGTLLGGVLLSIRFRLAAVDDEDPNELWRDKQTGFGRLVKVNEPGELLFQVSDAAAAHKTFQGYKNDPAAGNKKIVRDLFQKGDAFIRSGDLLRRGEDGLIYFVDRMGDTFRWKSENVSTNQVEEVIGGVSGIDQSVVVGVKVPNHEGRAGFAVIKPLGGKQNPPSLDVLSGHLLKELPRYAVPIFVKFVDEIERTGNNKIQKVKYRNQEIPCKTETIYWLKADKYVELRDADWAQITAGRSKL